MNETWPQGLTLKPAWIEEGEAEALSQWIDTQPWDTSLKRRTQHYGYRFDYTQRRSGKDLFLGSLPKPLDDLANRLADEFACAPFDQVIINEYVPGQGIGPHIDRTAIFGPVVASLSLLSATMMQFSRDHEVIEIDLPACSLIGLTDVARTEWKHAIPARHADQRPSGPRPRARRLSVTFRQMLDLNT